MENWELLIFGGLLSLAASLITNFAKDAFDQDKLKIVWQQEERKRERDFQKNNIYRIEEYTTSVISIISSLSKPYEYHEKLRNIIIPDISRLSGEGLRVREIARQFEAALLVEKLYDLSNLLYDVWNKQMETPGLVILDESNNELDKLVEDIFTLTNKIREQIDEQYLIDSSIIDIPNNRIRNFLSSVKGSNKKT